METETEELQSTELSDTEIAELDPDEDSDGEDGESEEEAEERYDYNNIFLLHQPTVEMFDALKPSMVTHKRLEVLSQVRAKIDSDFVNAVADEYRQAVVKSRRPDLRNINDGRTWKKRRDWIRLLFRLPERRKRYDAIQRAVTALIYTLPVNTFEATAATRNTMKMAMDEGNIGAMEKASDQLNKISSNYSPSVVRLDVRPTEMNVNDAERMIAEGTQ